MLSDNKRLSLLIRRNAGRHKLDSYKQFFKGFNLKGLTYIELEHADEVLDKVGNIFPLMENISEMIKNDDSEDSFLIGEVSDCISHKDTCYIYTDDVYECGMFTASSKSVLDGCLTIAFLDLNNTCFIVDCNFRFSFTINYNDIEDRDYPDKFDIQRRMNKELFLR